jgi:hypothetical protein
MKPWALPSGLQHGTPFILDPAWSPEQALAVIELLDDLREVIWCRYELQILELKRQQQCTEFDSPSEYSDHSDPDAVPF